MKLARTILPFAAAGLLAVSAFASGDTPREATPLIFNTYQGQKISLAGLKGKVVGVLFFSTNCPHCQKTVTLLAPIYADYKDKGFEIIGLAVNPQAAANIDEFASKYGVKFPIGLGTRSQWTTFCELPVMRNNYVPHLVFVDKNGMIQEDHPGMDRSFWLEQEKNIRSSVERLLAQ